MDMVIHFERHDTQFTLELEPFHWNGIIEYYSQRHPDLQRTQQAKMLCDERFEFSVNNIII